MSSIPGCRPNSPTRSRWRSRSTRKTAPRPRCCWRRRSAPAPAVSSHSRTGRGRGTSVAPGPRACCRGRPPTAQTRAEPRTGAPTNRTAAHARQPRQLEPRRPVYPPPMGGYGPDASVRRGPAERPRRSRAARRFFAFLAVVVLFVAAVAVAITIATSTSNNVVHFRKGRRPRHRRRRQAASEHHRSVHEIAPVASPSGDARRHLGSLGHSPGRESPDGGHPPPQLSGECLCPGDGALCGSFGRSTWRGGPFPAPRHPGARPPPTANSPHRSPPADPPSAGR